jgi:hypothetical protein
MGGGSQSSGVTHSDTSGIAGTLQGFMQSVKTGNSDVFLSPRMRQVSSSSGGVRTLEVWDFGVSIEDTEDNVSHEFIIPEDGINQLSDDYAKAYAVKSEGASQLRIDFELVKIDGQWFIESIAFEAKDLGYAVAESLMPLQKENEWQYISVPVEHSEVLFPASVMKAAIFHDPETRDGRQVYTLDYSGTTISRTFSLTSYASTINSLKTSESWSVLQSLYGSGSTQEPLSLRADMIDLFTQPYGNKSVGYANELGLFQYGTDSFNSGNGVKFLDATSYIGDTQSAVVNVNWSDESTYQVFMASRLAGKMNILTFAGPFEAWRVDFYAKFIGSVPEGADEEMFWSRLYSENKGEVAQVILDDSANATGVNLLYSAVVNGNTISPVDPGTTGETGDTGELNFVVDAALEDAVAQESYETQLVSGGRPPYTIEVSGELPEGLEINQQGYLSGAPYSSGDYSFNVAVTDQDNQSQNQTFSLTVLPVGSIPLQFIMQNELPAGAARSEYNVTLVSGGAPEYTFELGVDQTLPSGLTFSSAGISGIPDESGLFSLDLTVTDQNGDFVNRTFNLFINIELQFGPESSLIPGTTGKEYSMPLAVGGVPELTQTVISGSLPPGLELLNTGIEGTPTSAGVFTFTVEAEDQTNKTISADFSLEIVNPPEFITEGALSPTVINQAYSQDLVTGGKAPYAHEVISGAMPYGIIFQPDGTLSGSTDTALGVYEFELTVTDSIGNTIQSTFSIEVVGILDIAPTIKTNLVLGSEGGNAEYYETPNKIIPVTGGYLIVGSIMGSGQDAATSKGGLDVWAVKMSSTGQIQWKVNHGGSGDDEAFSACETDDGNYVIVGTTQSSDIDVAANNGGHDIWVLKIRSSDGGIEWEKTYGGSNNDEGRAIAFSTFDGLFIAGNTTSNDGMLVNAPYYYPDRNRIWVLKINPDTGAEEWNRVYGGSDGLDEANDMRMDMNNNLYILGVSASTDGERSTGAIGGQDAWLLKLDARSETIGSIIGQHSFGGMNNDVGRSMRFTEDGGFVIVGDTFSSDVQGYNSSTDVFVCKVDVYGTAQWQRAFGGGFAERGYDVELLPDGGFLVVGSAGSSDTEAPQFYGNVDGYLLKIDANGDSLWQQTYGGDYSEYLKSVSYYDNKVWVAGTSNSIDNHLSERTDYITYDWWLLEF